MKLRALVTGELAGTWCVLINTKIAAGHPRKSEFLPYGYRKEIAWSDGTTTDGVLKPVPIWYIETPDARIIVDTSFDTPEAFTQMRLKYGFPSYARRRPEWEIPAALAMVDRTPDDIDIVILTHCHYDHMGSNELFRRARFFAHRNEVLFALAPPPYAAHYLQENAKHIINVRDRLTILDDEEVIVPGVRTWWAGGHSPGSIIVIVDTEDGPAAIMADVMHDYLNLERWWPGTGDNYWCIDELVRAYARVREEARIILPGHDWKLWDIYPEGRVI